MRDFRPHGQLPASLGDFRGNPSGSIKWLVMSHGTFFVGSPFGRIASTQQIDR
jgi:hypothetical protein